MAYRLILFQHRFMILPVSAVAELVFTTTVVLIIFSTCIQEELGQIEITFISRYPIEFNQTDFNFLMSGCYRDFTFRRPKSLA